MTVNHIHIINCSIKCVVIFLVIILKGDSVYIQTYDNKKITHSDCFILNKRNLAFPTDTNYIAPIRMQESIILK